MPDSAPLLSDRERQQRLLGLHYPPETIASLNKVVAAEVLADSPNIRDGNFQAIAPSDLDRLFRVYDVQFFQGHLSAVLQAQHSPLLFKLSRRLTRSAGTTTRFQHRRPDNGQLCVHYEIAVSTTLLFQSFADVQRTVRVNGLECKTRFEALQRVFEHELLHLLEMLTIGRSNCAAQLYKMLAWNIFGHPETKHELVTQHERAQTQFGVRVGDRVAFTFEGVRHVGLVSRITRRATVLVENPAGVLYGDGKRYQKFYVPLTALEKQGPA